MTKNKLNTTYRGPVGTPVLVKRGDQLASSVRFTGYALPRVVITAQETVDLEEIGLEELQEWIQKMFSLYGAAYTDMYIEKVTEHGYYDDSVTYNYVLYGTREVTQMELDQQAEDERKRQEAQDKRDGQEFARLQKKFGKKNKGN